MYAILGSRGGEANDNTQNLKAGFITKHNETLVWVLYFQWTLSSYQAFKCLSCYKAFPDPKVFDEAGFVKTIIIPSFISRLLKLTPGLPRWLSSKQAAYQAGDSSSILGLGRPPGEKKKKKMATNSSILVVKSRGQRSLRVYSPWNPKNGTWLSN